MILRKPMAANGRTPNRLSALIMALVIGLAFLVAVPPMTVRAAGTPQPITIGTGTLEDPYIISTADQLAWFAEQEVEGTMSYLWNLHYKLNDDIDLSEYGSGFEPIKYFYGTFDGGGHTITGLYINNPNKSRVGLFGHVEGTVKNLNVIDATVIGNENVGIVAGELTHSASAIENCHVSGSVTGKYKVGGVVGLVGADFDRDRAHGKVISCSSSADVTGKGGHVGGIAGRMSSYDLLKNCYSTGTVSGIPPLSNLGTMYIGGVVGLFEYGTIEDCYFSGEVSGGDNSERIGGVVGGSHGYSTLQRCYSTGVVNGTKYVGGIAGYNGYELNTSYSTGTVSGVSYVGGIVGLNEGYIHDTYSQSDANGTYGVGGIVGFHSADVIYRVYSTVPTSLNLNKKIQKTRQIKA